MRKREQRKPTEMTSRCYFQDDEQMFFLFAKGQWYLLAGVRRGVSQEEIRYKFFFFQSDSLRRRRVEIFF